MRRRIKRLLYPLLRGAVAVLALLGYLTAAIGVPLPTPAQNTSANESARSTTPVHPCGCCTVSDCAGPCCCCCGESAPAEAAAQETEVVWLIGEQVRKCH